ncbi:hypothetical protein BGHDH14_bgh00167 [Blumeria hordei DH14]|uniref:Aminomethyltransferase n=1 Tax=Blumeria graminis f. sp. hordei (strain DH14) TaxID=546991 RepID=N1J8F7_BLUG1|nr:hypothetical protein BGHDH14_bgh00167 [Blumeria hordei DH14]
MQRLRPMNRLLKTFAVSDSTRHYSNSLLRNVKKYSSPQLQSNRWTKSVPKNAYIISRNASSDTKTLAKTPLYDFHVTHGGKMVGFGGYHMPVQYSSLSISESHHFTRTHASLFDVSHMVQHIFSGPGATSFLERITPSDITGLDVSRAGLSTILKPKTGGIIDDTIISKLDVDNFYMVTNAGCREKDLIYLREELDAFAKEGEPEVNWNVMEGYGLIALQGPLSQDILSSVLDPAKTVNLVDMHFGQCKHMQIHLLNGSTSSPLIVTRGGYTGEDGFEISIPPQEVVEVTNTLLHRSTPEKLQLAGLAARDSLRLEAGMCLYGHDLDENTTPVEAGLSWVIGKSRRSSGGFHGSEVILPQLTPRSKGGMGVQRRRIGLIIEGVPAREGAEIVNANGDKIGQITSGCPSPTLGKNIAMGYIKDKFHKPGTEVDVIVRGKKRKAQVTKMPFVTTNYWKGKA